MAQINQFFSPDNEIKEETQRLPKLFSYHEENADRLGYMQFQGVFLKKEKKKSQIVMGLVDPVKQRAAERSKLWSS